MPIPLLTSLALLAQGEVSIPSPVEQALRVGEFVKGNNDRTLLLWGLFCGLGLAIWVFYSMFTQQRVMEAKRQTATDEELGTLRAAVQSLTERMAASEVRHGEEKTRVLERAIETMEAARETMQSTREVMERLNRTLEDQWRQGGGGGGGNARPGRPPRS